jgi:hypothetical protein
MESDWADEEAKPHNSLFNLFCRSQNNTLPRTAKNSSAPESDDFEEIMIDSSHVSLESYWDSAAAYFHRSVKTIMVDIEYLMEGNRTSFQKLLCPICKKRQPKYIYVHGDNLCQHFYACKDCDKKALTTLQCANSNVRTKKITPKFFARCSGCNLENVNTYCQRCKTMEYCSHCARATNPKGEYLHKCSCSPKKIRNLIECTLPGEE